MIIQIQVKVVANVELCIMSIKITPNRGFKFTHWNMKKQMNYNLFTQIKIMAVKETIKQ